MMQSNEERNMVVAVLKPAGNAVFLRKDDRLIEDRDGAVKELFDMFDSPNITVVRDDEWRIVDIRENDESFGFFPVRTLCQTLGIPVAKLVYHGEYNQETLTELVDSLDYQVHIIPLFGTTEEDE